jgi:RNA polymerase sigma-B factor
MLAPAANMVDKAEEVQAWLSEYAATRNPALRDRIVLAHLGLAERVTARFRERPTCSREDLLQTARVGLVAAVTRYDPQRGVPFFPYAIACMVGEIKRSLRDSSWGLHVSRRMKELAIQVLPELDRLRVELRRAPTLAELAARLHEHEELIAEAIEAVNAIGVLSLDRSPTGGEAPIPLREVLEATDGTDQLDDRLVLPELVGQLPEVERRVVILYFFEELKQRDIGGLLGCSQMQVSRLLHRALARLRSMLVFQ